MRKLTLLSALVLLGTLLVNTSWAQSYKFKSTPHLPILSTQTVVDRIYVPTNTKMTDVRVALYAKVVYYNSLRIVLTAPSGHQVVLTNAPTSYFNTAIRGSFGSERSWTLFQDGGATNIYTVPTQPNDRPVAPVTAFATLSGKPAMGWWTISVQDQRGSQNFQPYQNGYLEGWAVIFNSVITEPEMPIYQATKTGAQLIGQMNGQISVIPNEDNALDLCTTTGEPNVTPGLNGDCYPFIISNTGYPGLLVGANVPGFQTGGRFKITVNIATNLTPPSPVSPAFTGDIAVYFGKVATFNPPLQAPPSPAKPAGVAAQWPTGSGGFTNQLLPLTAQPLHGGVRLSACNNADVPPWNLPFGDEGGYIDVTFDDRALTSIQTADVSVYGDGVAGVYRPENALSLLNGTPLEGLYYVTIYDAFGENFNNVFGHIRVLGIQVEYLAGGGETANPNMHEGIAGPLLGVPIPGRITGSPLGYLPDVISTVPPYAIHAKDQDPMLLFWGVQKMGPRPAVGWELIQARQGTTMTAIANDGPYAYPAALDANRAVAGVSVNADLAILPTGTYNLRSTLSQQRYDDDNTDNWIESAPVQVTNTTLAYYGTKVNQSNYFQSDGNGIYISLPFQPNGSTLAGVGVAFTLFKFPYTSVTSVDYMFDAGQLAQFANRTDSRIRIWRCANGFTGAPVGPAVAMSPTVTATQYHTGNWRTFPIYACDANGNITSTPSVNLSQGTYIVTLDNMSTGTTGIIWPYTYGLLPYMDDRYKDYMFSEKFGPLGPFSTLGTRLQYQYTAAAQPPTSAFSAASTPSTFGNFTLPFRLNMTTLSDFAVNHVAMNGLNGTESIQLSNAPFQPSVSITANSLQGGNTKDFNIRLEIFDQGLNRVYMSDVMYGPNGNPSYPGINGYQTVSVPMAQWNPAVGGLYKVKAWFSRKPDDQNPVNDVIEYNLYVSTTRAILATGAGVNTSAINEALAALTSKGVSVDVMKATDAKVLAAKGTDIYVIGSINMDDKSALQTAIENGNNLAFVHNRSEKIGSILRNVDLAFDIDRPGANYDKMDLYPKVEERASTQVKAPVDVPTFTSKEELVAYVKANQPTLSAIEEEAKSTPVNDVVPEWGIPVERGTAYGDVQFVQYSLGDMMVVYAVPQNRKAGQVKTEVATPAGFVLEQNYPNPFNPSTMISYSLPENSVVTLRIMDMLGREVMTLANGTQEAGRYTTSWNGLNQNGEKVSSGSYFFRLDAAPVSGAQPFSSQKKMTLAK